MSGPDTKYKQQYQSYAAATQTVAKTKQIVLLYDGIIRFMQQAKDAIGQKRIEDRYKALTRASDIVMGLQSCLDFEQGGHIAKVLYSFYSSIETRIFSLHRAPNPELCEELIAEVKQMRDVWHEIDQNSVVAPAPAAQPAAENPAEPKTITLSA